MFFLLVLLVWCGCIRLIWWLVVCSFCLSFCMVNVMLLILGGYVLVMMV